MDVRVNEHDELTNVITTVGRVQGCFAGNDGAVSFDRIQVAFDANTFQRNTETRFDEQSAAQFFAEAVRLRASLLAESEEHLNG
jgi:hypothetical protein